ncbi:UDP-N-acetylglucosamine diphosphorylase [Anaerovoracaceae bacterium 41-7]|jgi:bifunctional UDP-N-acetylglucosamine pyrophosphorylase/glucosamine-1-phosphate N-acetyltransferase|uniref:UDP-N-acetylglucosamine diphosphorylase n=1 Tax=Anaerotruncus colihominis TaxID=169435 RepID=A0A845QL21_9FIRM|nr:MULTISPECIES: UDP-N-acetylglucosamine diphosphorylase [Clostridia]MCI9477006.1 UDP-N-acetylglucosamine diphosphorylase [Emergencia sp.]MCI9638995.1 UDP-N-acetylglucosamine diphosphorylase [Emergencia sp.]NBH62790.1 UDP-N-acetylglucosamine diphosphorylase [Anaerotruncus colihominis]NCE97774.1 UDP-N-acetylglucosamine diphosphorylase [Emergencia sp. 1XD21-10]NCF03444.1 UDP-N-acetylglucosamine diphosphorylase [Anaerotruncus sp. 80]
MTYLDYKEKEALRKQVAIRHLENGVEFVDINTAYIDETVTIGAGTLIGPCVTLEGQTFIGEGCTIYQNTRIKDSVISDGASVQSSVIMESKVGKGTKVGPFAYLRPGCTIGENCKVGDFVEVKNSSLGDGSKASHLTYIGDSDVGRDVNIGCGVVFVNYDGTNKHRSNIGDGAFIGCNTNLVSPVSVEDGAYIAAGSTITEDVPKDSLAIARQRQRNIEGWAREKGLYKKK